MRKTSGHSPERKAQVRVEKKWHSTTLKRALIFALVPLGIAAIVVNVLVFLVFR